jgi:hypothetical protein
VFNPKLYTKGISNFQNSFFPLALHWSHSLVVVFGGGQITAGSHVCDLTMSPFFSSAEPPNSLDLNGTHPRRIKLTAPNINLSLDQSEGSVLSDDNLDSPDEIDINVDELDTPDEADSFEYTGHGKSLSC